MSWFEVLKKKGYQPPKGVYTKPALRKKIKDRLQNSSKYGVNGLQEKHKCSQPLTKKQVVVIVISAWFEVVKKQERTFVIESYSTEDEPYKDISVNVFLTAKELGIKEDFTQEDIEDELLEWIGDNIGTVSGYIWYEITAEGKKRDWLNPRGDYELV